MSQARKIPAVSHPPTRFVLLVCEGPYTHQAADTALLFARAVMEKGHVLKQVFFYHDGVYLASGLAAPEQTERRISADWSEFARASSVELVVCSNAALKRGIVDKKMAVQAGVEQHNLAPAFTMAGLGQFAEVVAQSDRLVRFGA